MSQRRVDSTARDSAGPAPASRGDLLLVAGPGVLTTQTVERDELTIGRDPACDVVLEHRALSRRHAVLHLGPPVSVEDLGSTNGTRVIGRVVRGAAAVLPPGEAFHIGPFSFVLVKGSASPTSVHSGGDPLQIHDPTTARATPVLRDIARSDVNVLILGETGVGKEVLAETLHGLSGRHGPLVRINCAALSESLLEGELFGHVKGAFTGAVESRAGLLEAAAGGTAFLDEVGELPAAIQAKLLRAVETREIVRVGSTTPVRIDVRFVSATNRDLPAEVETGGFRRDLFFRLDGVTLRIPPLRERRGLIAALAIQFLGEGARLTPEVLAALEQHAWPGNVRELKAVLERASLLARGATLARKHLQLAPTRADVPAPRVDSDRDGERAAIVEALARAAGNQTRAAKALGMSRSTLAVKLQLYRIPRPKDR